VSLMPESLHYAEKGGEPWIAGRRQGFVEGFARDAGLRGKLGHSNGARDIAECGCDESGVAILEGGFEIGGDGLRIVEIL
jgi:hypothetical protein